MKNSLPFHQPNSIDTFSQAEILNIEKQTGRVHRLIRFIKSEIEVIHPRLWFAQLLVALLPVHVGGRLRALALSMAGFDIGQRTVLWGMPIIVGHKNFNHNLHIGQDCWLQVGCYLDLGGQITIDDRAGIGYQAMLMTTTHEIGGPDRRLGPVQSAPIHIGKGVWLGARCIIMPGVTVHDGAIVGAGAVVTKDVPPNTIVAGVPARVIRSLEDPE
jgi:maltose O-acetyltransferase